MTDSAAANGMVLIVHRRDLQSAPANVWPVPTLPYRSVNPDRSSAGGGLHQAVVRVLVYLKPHHGYLFPGIPIN